MKAVKNFVLLFIFSALMFLMLMWGILRADRICKEANDNRQDYRFCMGI